MHHLTLKGVYGVQLHAINLANRYMLFSSMTRFKIIDILMYGEPMGKFTGLFKLVTLGYALAKLTKKVKDLVRGLKHSKCKRETHVFDRMNLAKTRWWKRIVKMTRTRIADTPPLLSLVTEFY